MWIVRQVLDLLVMPIGLSVLLGTAAVVVALWPARGASRRRSVVAVILGAAAVGVLYVSSMRATGIFLTHWIERPFPVRPPESVEPVDAVMVFGGSTMFLQNGTGGYLLHPGPRFEAALALFGAGRAGALILSGCGTRIPADPRSEGEHLREEAIRQGVREDAVVITRIVRTTGDEARAVGAIARERGWKRIALVTDAFHMGRCMQLVAAQGVEPVPFPASGLTQPGEKPALHEWVPSIDGLWYTTRAWHEIVGRLLGSFEARLSAPRAPEHAPTPTD